MFFHYSIFSWLGTPLFEFRDISKIYENPCTCMFILRKPGATELQAQSQYESIWRGIVSIVT
jgi:hypothetical protein